MAIFKSQKHVFWQAFILTAVVFVIGILLGIALENYRAEKIGKLYVQAEIDLLDMKILSQAFSVADLNCEEAEKENVEFADRIYKDALFLQELENAERITEALKVEHKKYDLLRTLLWLNSVGIKEKCNSSYHNIVYLYQYNKPSWEKRARQEVFSDFLADLKEKYSDKIILIPIAADLNLSSVDLLVRNYGVTVLPTILIDEKVRITEVTELEEIETYL